MPKAYSEDLCLRIVWLHLIHHFSYAEIAEVLFMCKKSVMRYIDLFNSTGSVAPTEQINGPQKLLTEFEQLYYTNLEYTYMKCKINFTVHQENLYTFQPYVEHCLNLV